MDISVKLYDLNKFIEAADNKAPRKYTNRDFFIDNQIEEL